MENEQDEICFREGVMNMDFDTNLGIYDFEVH